MLNPVILFTQRQLQLMTNDICFAILIHTKLSLWYNYNNKLMMNNNIAEFLFQICHMITCAASVRPAQTDMTEEDNKPTTH